MGILKERNVDVEHRFNTAVSRGRKKSTKCRLVFRTFVTLPSGVVETLQVVSQPIACSKYLCSQFVLLSNLCFDEPIRLHVHTVIYFNYSTFRFQECKGVGEFIFI